MEHEKRCRLEKKPAVLRYFIYVVRYHYSDIMFLIRRNFTNCYFSGIVGECCNCRWYLFLLDSTKRSLIDPPGQVNGYFTVPLAYKSIYYDTEIMYCDPIIINFILQNVRSDVTIFLKRKILTCKR